MINMKIDGFTRVSLKKAKLLYRWDMTTIYVTSDNLRPGYPWNPEAAIIYDPELSSLDNDTNFNHSLNAISYYASSRKPLMYWIKLESEEK